MPDAYLKLGELNGESTDARYKGWIPVESFSFDQAQRGGAGSGHGDSARGTDISVTKFTDRTSTDIMKAVTMGLHFDHAIICMMGKPEGMVGSAILMDDVYITGVQFSGGAGGESKPMESVSLNFTKITMGTAADYSAPYGPAAPANRKKLAAPAGRPTAAAGTKRP